MSDDADSSFAAHAVATLDGMLDLSPELATELGDHRHDDRLTVGTVAHYEQESRWARERLAGLAAIDAAQLSPQNRVDAQILANHLARVCFGIDDLREHEWNPMAANPGRAIYLLLARDFAPLPQRLRSVSRRLACLPEALAAARTVLGAMPEVHIETALTQFAGTQRLIASELASVAQGANGAQRELDETAPAAVEAIEEHIRWLRQRLADGTRDGFRDPCLGAELYSAKLRLVLDTEMTAEDVLARAEAELARTSEEIEAAAEKFSGPGADGGGPVRRTLDSLAADAPDDTTILGLVRAAFGAQREFVAKHDLVTIFGGPVEVIEMPEIDRGVAIAYCDPPGPLETAPLPTFIAVSPTPEDWPAERVRSFYREYNRHMVHNLMIHEAMPGHALQLEHSRRFAGSTPVRAMLRSGSFVEGWAVYAEQLMGARGYPGDGNPAAVGMQRLKMKLRMIINAIMDARVHCSGMTQDQAMALMTGPGYQEDGEATAKWRRVLLTSAQLSTYFVGYTEVSDLTSNLRGTHPGWGDRQVHDAVLGHGSPPVRHLRTLLAAPSAGTA
jgi:uncharacterized protein (DUF885 family)